MGQRATGKRAVALRKARAAKAAQDAERLQRDQRIEQALADFYQATAQAEQIRHAARQRADKVVADADVHARDADGQARKAVRTLRALGQTNAEVSHLCGITVNAVRAMANEADSESSTEPAMERTAIEPAPMVEEGARDRRPVGDSAARGARRERGDL